MRRREFISLIGGVAAMWPLAVRAQQPTTKIARVGWLVAGSPTSHRFSLAAFRGGLKALGYVEGQNISIEYRWAEGNVTRLPELANELVREKVDIILAGGSVGAEAAKHATSLIPIIAAGVADLVDVGLVTDLARPGGNLTGFVVSAPETAAKRFQIILEIEPQARRAAVLWNSASSSAKLEWEIAKKFAAANDIAVDSYDARAIEQLSDALIKIPRSGAEFLVVLNDPFMFTYRKAIVDAANRLRLPAIYGFREFVEDGGMISYGTSLTDTYRRAAGLSTKFSGAQSPPTFQSSCRLNLNSSSISGPPRRSASPCHRRFSRVPMR